MQQENRVYIAIDLKSFYASVECRERRLDPLTTGFPGGPGCSRWCKKSGRPTPDGGPRLQDALSPALPGIRMS